jgi:hypothetical protein
MEAWTDWPCAAHVTEQQAGAAVVFVQTLAPDGPGPDAALCSGVLIAPTLVLTSRQCATALAPGAEFDCDRTNQWAPVSEHPRPSYLGPSLDVDGNIIIVAGGSPSGPRDALVEEIVTTDATSFCVDDFALLFLRSSIEVEPVPLRLAPVTQLGEDVLLSGFGGAKFFPKQRRSLAAVVSRITSEQGDVRAPPRSLFLRGNACTYDRGGAVFAPQTGALIGTIVNDPASDCDSPNPSTLAVDLAQHADFLLQAAGDRGVALRTELNPDIPRSRQPPACTADEP